MCWRISPCLCSRGKDVKGKRSFFSPLTGSLNGKNNTDRSCRSSDSEVRCAGQQNDVYFELRSISCVTADQKKKMLLLWPSMELRLIFHSLWVIGHLWLCEGNAPLVNLNLFIHLKTIHIKPIVKHLTFLKG